VGRMINLNCFGCPLPQRTAAEDCGSLIRNTVNARHALTGPGRKQTPPGAAASARVAACPYALSVVCSLRTREQKTERIDFRGQTQRRIAGARGKAKRGRSHGGSAWVPCGGGHTI
jgi:hypothetical protein